MLAAAGLLACCGLVLQAPHQLPSFAGLTRLASVVEAASRPMDDSSLHNGTALVIEIEDCSENDGDSPPGVYTGRVLGLEVRFTKTGEPVPTRMGKATLPLGHNLTILIVSDRSVPTPIGTTFSANTWGFPFWASGQTCDPSKVILPLGLGGVNYAGTKCPVPAGRDGSVATVQLPPVLPLAQLGCVDPRALNYNPMVYVYTYIYIYTLITIRVNPKCWFSGRTRRRPPGSRTPRAQSRTACTCCFEIRYVICI